MTKENQNKSSKENYLNSRTLVERKKDGKIKVITTSDLPEEIKIGLKIVKIESARVGGVVINEELLENFLAQTLAEDRQKCKKEMAGILEKVIKEIEILEKSYIIQKSTTPPDSNIVSAGVFARKNTFRDIKGVLSILQKEIEKLK